MFLPAWQRLINTRMGKHTTTDLIFDFFGTLVQYTAGAFHTAPYARTHAYLLQQGFAIPYEAFEATFTAVSDAMEARRKQTYREYHMDELGRGFFKMAFDIEVPDETVKALVSVFMQEWERGIVYLEGLDNLLERLASQYRLSILSNTHLPGLIPAHLAAMGIAQHFAQVMTSVEVGICKPHPVIFHHALEQLGIAPHEAIYIGDTYVDDFQGATSAGIPCALIGPVGQYPDVPNRITSVFALEQQLAFMHQNTARL